MTTIVFEEKCHVQSKKFELHHYQSTIIIEQSTIMPKIVNIYIF